MKRMVIKIIISMILQAVCFYAVHIMFVIGIYTFSFAGLVFAENAIILFLHLLLVILYKIAPLQTKKQKIAYWIFNECCVLLTLWFGLIRWFL